MFLLTCYQAIPQRIMRIVALRSPRSHRAMFESVPALQQTIATSLSSSLALKNSVVLSAYPCRPAAVRGLRARVVVCDELGFYRSSENLPIDREMLRAVRPCLATTGGKLIVLSSPYAQVGEALGLAPAPLRAGRRLGPHLAGVGTGDEPDASG